MLRAFKGCYANDLWLTSRQRLFVFLEPQCHGRWNENDLNINGNNWVKCFTSVTGLCLACDNLKLNPHCGTVNRIGTSPSGNFLENFLNWNSFSLKFYHLFKLLNEILGRFDEFFHQPVGIRTLRWLDGDFDAVQRYSKLQDFFLISKENERFKF